MKDYKKLISLMVSFLLIMLSCSCGTPTKPKFFEVDPRAKPYVDEYLDLSRQNNITFWNFVPVGIDDINDGNVIGYCWTTSSWREVELDANYFLNATEIGKKALVFHELTHCYCGRGHDFGPGQAYDKVTVTASTIPWSIEANPPGYFTDGCATSLMHPILQPDYCLAVHWSWYIHEMFDRCDPF